MIQWDFSLECLGDILKVNCLQVQILISSSIIVIIQTKKTHIFILEVLRF